MPPFPLGRLTELSLTRDYCKTSSKDTEKKEIHKESNFRAMLIRIEMASKKYCGMSVAVVLYYVLLLCSWYCYTALHCLVVLLEDPCS